LKEDYFNEQFLTAAATIDEVLSDLFVPLPTGKNTTDEAALRLSAMCKSACNGDWNLFSKRLQKDGLTIADVLARFSNVSYNNSKPLPDWFIDSKWVFESLTEKLNEKYSDEINLFNKPVAFQELLVGVIYGAQQKVLSGLAFKVDDLLSHGAMIGLCGNLLSQLSEISSPALYSYFCSYLKERVDVNSKANQLSNKYYLEFIAFMQETGFKTLFERKPVLLRLMATITRQWIDSTMEFLNRFSIDSDEIFRQFTGNYKLSITNIQVSLGDLHNFGRSVQLLNFEDGSKILYKPKDIKVDAVFEKLITELNAKSPPIDLKFPKTLVKNGYGWSEFIEHKECSNQNEFETYFFRAGAWICLLHLFVGTDIHEENIIAHSSYPIPVDIETILQAAEIGNEVEVVEKHATELAGRKVIDSVLETMMLPSYAKAIDKKVLGQGGLFAAPESKRQIVWENINSDFIKPVVRWEQSNVHANLPYFEKTVGKVENYIEELISGFELYSRFILKEKSTLQSADFISQLQNLPVRRLIRNTRFYYLLFERAKDFRKMDDGIKWSANFDFITRLMDLEKKNEYWWPLFIAERNALSDLNVPFFYSLADSNIISDCKGVSTTTGFHTGFSRCKDRIEKFNEEQIKWQSEVIRISTNSILKTSDLNKSIDSMPDLRQEAVLNLNLVKEKTTEIFNCILDSAIISGPSASWIGLGWLQDSMVGNLSPLPSNLYGGNAGISLFLAAYSKVMLNTKAKELSLAGIAALRYELKGINSNKFARALGVGGMTGLGSIVYSLVTIANILEDESILNDAKYAARLFTKELIELDDEFDFVSGSAGAIVALLKIHKQTLDSETLKAAINLGEHLLRKRHYKNEGTLFNGWEADVFLNGFSHGASGFAYALTSLALVTGRSDFSEAVFECIAYENNSYSEERNNWPDYSKVENDVRKVYWPSQWCHGATGIGFGRLGMFQTLNSVVVVSSNKTAIDELKSQKFIDDISIDIFRSLNRVNIAFPYPTDDMCCGNAGNIEFMFEVAKVFRNLPPDKLVTGFKSETEINDEALKRLMSILLSEKLQGDFIFSTGAKKYNLGLFKGLSGIGYTLLRRLDNSLPNVLLLQ
jgi:type 2 lantibiotic biosynthesis protein LanM